MKKLIILFSFLFAALNLFAQIDIENKYVVIHKSALDQIVSPSTHLSKYLYGTNDPVSTGTRLIYVSNSGNDGNTGLSQAQAWATIGKVNTSSVSGDLVLWNRGDVWSGTITGKQGVHHGSYGSGAKPVFDGSTTITDTWIADGSYWKVAMPSGVSTTNQIFYNNVNVPIARLDNNGDWHDDYIYLEHDNLLNDSTVVDADFIGVDLTNSTFIFRAVAWSYEERNVTTKLNDSTYIFDIVNHPDGDVYAQSAVDNYISVNVKDKMQENRYCFQNDTLYLWLPASVNPNAETIKISSISNAYELNAIDSINIKNLTIRNYNSSAITFEETKCDNITIENCELLNNYHFGIYAKDESTLDAIVNENCEFIKNNVNGSVSGGIYLNGSNCVVSNNEIDNIGLIEAMGVEGTYAAIEMLTGMWLFCDNSTAQYNKLNTIGYNGLHFVGAESEISYNHINDVCLNLQDGGNFYFQGTGTNTNVHHNIASGSSLDYAGSIGFYPDGWSDHYTFENNIATGLYSWGFALNVDSLITLNSNTTFNNKAGEISISFRAGDNPDSLTFTNNSFFGYSEYPKTIIDCDDISLVPSFTFTGNGVYNPINGWTYGSPWYSIEETERVNPTLFINNKTFYKEFQSLVAIDTIGVNYYYRNDSGKFNTAADLYNGTYTATSPLDDGAILKTNSGYIRSFPTNTISSGSGTGFIQVNFDMISNNNASGYFVFVGEPYSESWRYVSPTTRTHKTHIFQNTTNFSYGFRDLRGYISASDSTWIDNIEFYEVTVDTIDLDSIFRFYYNDSYTDSLTVTLPTLPSGKVWKTPDGDLLPASKKIAPFAAFTAIKDDE